MIISSKDNKIVKYLTKLNESKKMRDEESRFLVEGYNLVKEAKAAGCLIDVYSLKEEADYPDSTIITMDILKKITNTVTPEGIIGLCKKPENDKLSSNILYLDRLQDPGNIGTLLRSALSFNFTTVILDESVDIYNPKVVRASQGSIFNLSFISLTLDELKELGYKILSTSMHGYSLREFKDIPEKKVLILGNEGNGVRTEYRNSADINLTIPMNKMESLNVGVAGSILMYELSK